MKTSIFDNPPNGFDRAKVRGWLHVAPGPNRKAIDKLNAENADLKSRLEQLEAAVAEIVSKKGKK